MSTIHDKVSIMIIVVHNHIIFVYRFMISKRSYIDIKSAVILGVKVR